MRLTNVKANSIANATVVNCLVAVSVTDSECTNVVSPIFDTCTGDYNVSSNLSANFGANSLTNQPINSWLDGDGLINADGQAVLTGAGSLGSDIVGWNYAELNVVTITAQPQDGSVNKDIAGSSLVLSVSNTGNATYKWKRLVATAWEDITGEISNSLTIEGGDFDSIGTEYYRVDLFDGANTIQSVAAAITIEEQPFTPAETSTLSGSISKIPDGNYTFTFYNENDNTFIVKKSVYFFNEYFSQELDVPSGTTVLYSTPRTSGDDTGASNYGVTT